LTIWPVVLVEDDVEEVDGELEVEVELEVESESPLLS
jgi:hypothetical protein